MSGNFTFLKKINKDLFEIISEAEKLYRDEYFEQCMTQTRRFGEQVCKNMLEQNNKQTGSFDEMIATLKDYTNGHVQEKEFIDDLYFLKKNGNQAVHSNKIKKDGIIALECLQRAFEVAINYSVYNQGAPANILKLEYDIELLVTEKKSKKSLKDRYLQEKEKTQIPQTTRKQNIKKEQTQKNTKTIFKPHLSLFWYFVAILSCISILIILVLTILIKLKQV